jgi:hypothetical protein
MGHLTLSKSRPSLRHLALVLGLGAGLALAGDVAAEIATPAPAKPARQCFFLSDWSGWHSPDGKVLYLKVRGNETWRVDLNSECNMLRDPTAHLVTQVRGTSTICSPLDLDLSVADTGGFKEPCFVKSIRQLSKEEAEAIPKKDRP